MADAFWTLLAPVMADLGIPPASLVMADQNAPRPAKPYATLDVTDAGAAPWLIELEPDEAGNARFVEHRLANVEVQFYGQGAQERAGALGMRLRLPSNVNRAVALGIGVGTVRGATGISVLLNETQRETRGLLEFTAHVAAELTDNIGLIERVVLDCPPGHQHVIDAPVRQTYAAPGYFAQDYVG